MNGWSKAAPELCRRESCLLPKYPGKVIVASKPGTEADLTDGSDCVLYAGPNLPRGNAARGKIARSATLTSQR